MPKRSRNEIKAGLFILLAFGLLCAGIIVIADFKSFMRPKQTHYFSFDQIQGLKVNHEVRYAGIKCGRVTAIEDHAVDDNGAVGTALSRVLVTIEIDGDIPVADHDKPMISRGFTGNVYMDIIPYERLRPDESLGEPLETSRAHPHPGYHYPTMQELFEKAQVVVEQVQVEIQSVSRSLRNVEVATGDVRHITGRVRAFVDRNETKFDGIVENVSKATRNVEDITVEAKPKVLAAVQDIRDLVANARRQVEALLPKLGPILDKLDAAAVNIRTASDDVKVTTAQVKEMVIANRPNIDGTMEEMRQAAARLNLGMEDIRRNPWKLLTRNIEADAYTQNIYDATMRFAEGARALSQAAATLHALQSQPTATPDAVDRAKERLKKLAEEMPKLEAMLFEALQRRPR